MEKSEDARKRNHHHNYHTNQQLFFPKMLKFKPIMNPKLVIVQVKYQIEFIYIYAQSINWMLVGIFVT